MHHEELVEVRLNKNTLPYFDRVLRPCRKISQMVTFANAAVYTWQCASNDLWSNAACWTNGDLDDAGDDMVLALSQVVTMDDDRDVKGFTISAGILSITSGDTLGLNNAHSTLSGTGTVMATPLCIFLGRFASTKMLR